MTYRSPFAPVKSYRNPQDSYGRPIVAAPPANYEPSEVRSRTGDLSGPKQVLYPLSHSQIRRSPCPALKMEVIQGRSEQEVEIFYFSK